MTRPQRRTHSRPESATFMVERVQTGVRIEKSILKVLKALAAFHDMSLGDLMEGIVLHAFEGRAAFGAAGLARIHELRRIYGMRFDASHSHRMIESAGEPDHAVPPAKRQVRKRSGGRRVRAAGRRT